ncbi:toxin-antitoxin system, toxin component [Undibacterium sp. TC4M20W]
MRLTVTHEELSPEVHRGISFGWPLVLSSLKSLLETGRGIDY